MGGEAEFGDFDYVIVGAGTAGCALANRLSADPDQRVLLLEAGGKDDYFWIHVPVGYLYTINNPRTDWCFKTEAEPGLNGRALNYPRGRVLGGCSSINAMIYMRGQARDYDHWRQLGNVGWAWDDVLPYFKRSEDFTIRDDDLHGRGGEWRVEETRLRWEILEAFRESARAVGIPFTDDFNRGNNEGCAYFHVNQKQGVRWNTAKAFLRPVAGRTNLTVVTDAQASRILFDGRRAVGVAFRQGGEIKHATARREVLLTSGSIGSPHLLQVSGVGPGSHLREHGIDVVHALDGVGANLQDHLQLRLIYRVSNTTTLNQQANSLFGKMKMGLEYALFKRGPLTMAPSQLGLFAKSDESRETPNLQYHVQPLSLDKSAIRCIGSRRSRASVCNLRPESRGQVRTTGPDPFAAPAIQPNYLSADADRRVAADAIRLTRRIVAAEPLAPFQPEEFLPGAAVQDQADLEKAAGDIGTTIFHPVGTARMGSDDGAVVDARLRVHGLEALRVVDASVMPTITSGNTNAPTLMIAERAADMIREDRRLGAAAA